MDSQNIFFMLEKIYKAHSQDFGLGLDYFFLPHLIESLSFLDFGGIYFPRVKHTFSLSCKIDAVIYSVLD